MSGPNINPAELVAKLSEGATDAAVESATRKRAQELYHAKKYDEASRELGCVLERKRRASPGDMNVSCAPALSDLGTVSRAAGRLEEALHFFFMAVQVYQRDGNAANVGRAANAMFAAASVAEQIRQWALAAQLLEQARAMIAPSDPARAKVWAAKIEKLKVEAAVCASSSCCGGGGAE